MLLHTVSTQNKLYFIGPMKTRKTFEQPERQIGPGPDSGGSWKLQDSFTNYVTNIFQKVWFIMRVSWKVYPYK